MALVETLRFEKDRELLTHSRAADFLHGCVSADEGRGGWVRPQRFTARQLRTLESCMAWHPGLFRQMAAATAGVCLRFRTDATEVALSVRLDPVPRATRAQLRMVEGGEPTRVHDGVSCDVDGRHLPVAVPVGLRHGLPGMPELEGASLVAFSLEEPDEAPEPGLQVLPGFGRMREVTLWLPCLAGCEVGDLWTNGLTVEPLPARPELLVLGDSIAQGFVVDDPALSWPVVLAKRLGFDLLNQGLYGQVFQQGTVAGLAGRPAPARIVVEFGTNYRFEPCEDVRTQREATGYLREVSQVWPDVPTQVMTPIWHDEATSPTHAHSCYEQVPYIIRRAAAPHAQMSVVEGTQLLDHDPSLLADPDHPNAAGAEELALRAYVSLRLGETPTGELATRALSVLEGAPARAFSIRECIRRGIGEVIFAEEGCVLLRVPDGNQYLFAPDHELGRAVVGLLCEPTLVTVCEPGFERDVKELLGLDLVEPYHLVVYEGKRRLAVDRKKARRIRPLDASFAKVCHEHYSYPKFVSEREMRRRLGTGTVLGAFEGDELVGFVGEHPEGSIGMLEVFSGHRGKGWGGALMSAKVNEQLGRGLTPWTEVYPFNKASLRLMERLGLTVYPATDQCFVSRKA